MKIGVLGAGQLGRMLALSAYPLGHQMRFLALSEEDPSSLLGKTFIHNNNPEMVSNFADSSDIVTYESENTDVTIVNEISKNTKVFPSDKSLYISQHRGREKALLDALKIPCAIARSLIGNHSPLLFTAPGQFPASPIPSNPLKIDKVITPRAKA